MPVSIGSLQGPVTGRRREAFINLGYNTANNWSCTRYDYDTDVVSATGVTWRDRSGVGSSSVGGFHGASNEGVAGYILGGGGNGSTIGLADKLAFTSMTTSALSNLSTAHGSSPTNLAQQRVEGYVWGGMNNTGQPHSVGEKVSFTTDTISASTNYPVNIYQGCASEWIGVAGVCISGKSTNLDANAIQARYKFTFSNVTFSSLANLNVAKVGCRTIGAYDRVYSMAGKNTSSVIQNDIQKYVYATNTQSTISATLNGTTGGSWTPSWSDWVYGGIMQGSSSLHAHHFYFATETIANINFTTPLLDGDSYWVSLQNSGAL